MMMIIIIIQKKQQQQLTLSVATQVKESVFRVASPFQLEIVLCEINGPRA